MLFIVVRVTGSLMLSDVAATLLVVAVHLRNVDQLVRLTCASSQCPSLV